MAVTIDPKFYDSFPEEKREQIMNRIKKFADELEKNKNLIRKLSKGFYCRQIKSLNNRYKFRINNGDRIVFCYQNNHKDIHLLRYCSHDKQVLAAANASISVEEKTYKEDNFDEVINKEAIDEYKQYLLDNDLLGAYNSLVKRLGTNKTNKANFLRKSLRIADLKKDYLSDTVQQGYSGICFPERDSVLNKQDLLFVFNKIYMDYKKIFSPFFTILFSGSVLDNLPFYSERANKTSNIQDYLHVLTDDLYDKIGTTQKHRSLILQGAFYDTFKDRSLSRKYNAFYVSPENRAVSVKDKLLSITEVHTNRINSYLQAVSVLNPQKIGRFNYHYLFDGLKLD